MEGKVPWHVSPIVAEGFAVAQYAVKVGLKIWIGSIVASGTIQGDGFHNIGDTVQALLIIVALVIKGLKPKGYPFQYKEVESLVLVLLGLVLIGSGIKVGFGSTLGILAQFPQADQAVRDLLRFLPQHEAVHIDARWLWPLIGLTSGSIMASLVLSWFQIRAGKYSGEATVIADGKETRMDAGVEALTLLGVILVQIFNWRPAEYMLGFLITALVLHTGWEIFVQGKDSLLKRSLGTDVEDALRRAVLAIPGVEKVTKIVTFRVGRGLAVSACTIETVLDANKHEGLGYALRRSIDTALKGGEDVRETEIYLTLVEPSIRPERIAYACRPHRNVYRIVSVVKATHFLICDLAQGDSSKGRVTPYGIEGEVVAFAAEKRITRVLSFGATEDEERATFESVGIALDRAYATNPEVELGVSLFRS